MRSRTAGALALVLIATLLVGGALAFILHAPDPLAAYRTADGGLRFFPAPKTYTTWEPARSSYPTLAILGTEHDIPQAPQRSVSQVPAKGYGAVDLFGNLRNVFRSLISFFVTDVSAACTGGNCFWIGGTGNFSDNTHWSLLSGGVTCVCTPGSTDTVTFDASSGSGTATQNNASFSSGAVAIGGSVVVNSSTNTWTVSGNWTVTETNGFDMGLSTVIFAASATATMGDSDAILDGTYDFYNLTVNAGVITTLGRNPTDIDIYHVFTINGKWLAPNGVTQITAIAGVATQDPIVVSGSTDLTQSGLLSLVNANLSGLSISQHVPAATYHYLALEGVGGTEIRFTGNITTTACGSYVNCAVLIRTYYGNPLETPTSFNVYTDNFSLTVGGTFWIGDGTNVGGTMWLGSSTVSANGMAPNGLGILHAQSSTITVNPSSIITPVALYLSSDGGSSYLYAETSTITVNGGVKYFSAADVIDLGSSSMSVGGNWDTFIGATVRGTSTVTLTASGTLKVNDDGNTFQKADFYNLTLAASVVTTFTPSPGIDNVLTLGANAELAVAGGDPQGEFRLNGILSTTPLVLGAGADMSHSGYFIYEFAQATGHVTAAIYQHLAIEGGSGATADLVGNISTPLCGVYNECAIIMLTFQPNTTFTFNTNNHNITAGGTFWIGDGGGFGVTFNAGSSAITGRSITPDGDNTVIHFQTAILTGRPSSTDTNICFETSGTDQVFFEQSTLNCYGQFRLSSSFIDAGSATINVIHDGACMPSADCGTDNVGSRSPGEVVIFSGTYIIFGSSTWRVDSIWQDNNTVVEPNWSAGTTTVTFHQTGINTNYRFGGGVLGVPEFHNMVFDFDVTATATMVFNPLSANGSITIRNTHSATTILDASTFSVTFASLAITSGGTLGKDGFSVTSTTFSTDSGTILLSAWTALDLTTPDVEWTFNPSSSSASVTVTKGGLAAASSFSLLRDGSNVQDATSNGSGSATFSVTNGWSSHAMKITTGPTGGGGGGGAPPGDAILVSQVSGLTYKFSVQSTTGTVTSVSWDFGDGKTATGTVVYHTFAQGGTYVVTAQVTKAGGSTEPLTKTITIASAIPLLTMILTFIVIMMIAAAFFVNSERRKFWLVAGAAAILAFDLTSYAKSFGSLDVVTALNAGLLLLAGIVSVVVGLLPTKEHRIRGKWLILGAVIFIAWWYLVLGGVL